MSLDWGPQYHPSTLIEWNLMGSTAQISQSAAGPNGLKYGTTTFEAGYPNMGDAARIDAAGEAVGFPSYQDCYWPFAGCYEAWYYNDGWTYTNGVASAGYHAQFGAFKAAPPSQVFDTFMHTMGYYWRWAIAGVNYGFSPGPIAGGLPGATALNQTWHHWAWVWNMLGIGGGANTCRIYFDGALVKSTNVAIVMPTYPDGFILVWGATTTAGANFWLGRVDNIKIWNYAKTDFSDRFTEGFTPPAPAPTPIVPECAVRRFPIVLVGGENITDWISETPLIEEHRTSGADGLFPDECKIEVSNLSGRWSLENPATLLTGNWQDTPVDVWDRWGTKIWNGILSNVDVDNSKRSAVLTSKSPLARWKDRPVVLPVDTDCPAAVLLDICTVIGFTNLDLATVLASIAIEQAHWLSVAVTLTAGDNVTFSQALSTLAKIGCADVYVRDGKLFYVAFPFNPRLPYPPGTPVVYLTADDLIGELGVRRRLNELVNDYAIYEAGAGTVITDSPIGFGLGSASRSINGTHVLKEIGSSPDVKFAIQNTWTAGMCGTMWMRRSHADLQMIRPRIEIKINVKTEARTWIEVGTDFAITYAREGWTNKIFRIVEWKRDDSTRLITVTAYEW